MAADGMSTEASNTRRILQQLRDGALRFVHVPQLWQECNLPIELEWRSVEFGKDHRGKVPSDEFGVYAFMLEPRECRQNNLVHRASARIWQMARKEASFLAYRVATALHCLKYRNAFSTK